MKIAMLPSAFFPSLGGVEEAVRQLSHELVRQGNSVELHANRWPKSLPAREVFEGLPLFRYPLRVPERTPRQLGGAILLGTTTLTRLCANIYAQAADVIHVQCVSSNAYYALKARRKLDLPLVVTLQGELTMDSGRLFQRSRFARNMLHKVLDEADVITSCSARTQQDAEAFYGRKFGARGRVIFNGASTADFKDAKPYANPRPYILALGRLAPQKGFDLLIRAMAQAGDCGHDLILAGDGPERGALEEMARKAGVGGRVRFVGLADRRQVAALFAGCSFLVLPSRADEGLPLVCAEALAAGRPVIASEVGGVAEVISDGVNGILVPRENAGALASAIATLCKDAELRAKLGAAAHADAGRFAWASIARQYADAYADARTQYLYARGG